MSFHRDNSLKDLISKQDFWENFRPKSENGRSMLYRYEHDGIIVYDCYARLCTEPAELPIEVQPREISQTIKKDIENANEYGKAYLDRLQYMSMKNYSSQKAYPQEYTLVVPNDKTLKFDSKFESGNLHKAIRVSENEYNLLLEHDTETKGYTQWYYFAVNNYKSNHTVRFNLINLMKYESLYNNGMKPLVNSQQKNKLFQTSWHRDGSAISYFRNSLPRKYSLTNSNLAKYYYTLTFTYHFMYANDKVFFAHCYPYTYKDLNDYLDGLTGNSEMKSIIRVNSLCKTLAGNVCPIVTITQGVDTYVAWDDEFSKMQKSAAARRIMKIREVKEEAKLKVFEYVKNIKILEGKS